LLLTICREWRKQPQEFIHIKGPEALYAKDEWGQVQPVEVPNIKPVYPLEFHQGLWGGEGIVKGFKRPMPEKHQPSFLKPQAWYWFPKLHETVVHSEVLDKYIRCDQINHIIIVFWSDSIG
jgi:hypothetical protein